MRLFLSSFGTAGDILPFERLARRMAARGHAVTVHSWDFYRAWFPSEARFVAAGGGVTDPEVDAGIDFALHAPTPIHQVTRFARLFYGLGDGTTRARATFDVACEALAGHDLALVNLLDLFTQAAARRVGVPWVAYTSRPTPPEAEADRAFAEVDAAAGALLAEVTGETRRVRLWRDPSPLANLAVFSRHLVASPDQIVTGAWLEPARDAAPDPDLADFLDDGPSLLVTFGTMPDVGERTRALLSAIAMSGWNALVQVLPPQPLPTEIPRGVLLCNRRLDFASLLPRVAAVVHHGSVGTVHEVVRAGRPSLVVPHMGDQFFWADVLVRRGLGPAPVVYTHLDARLLAERMLALRAPDYAARAAAMAPLLADEDGVGAAALALERIAAR